ncbi:hypothetical protein [Sulfurimonas sp.]
MMKKNSHLNSLSIFGTSSDAGKSTLSFAIPQYFAAEAIGMKTLK